MAARTTVIFADLTGSTAVFEALGNAKATDAVTRLTQWISNVCQAHGGRVVKTLGDGVLALFPDGVGAVAAAVEMQRGHHKRISTWPPRLRMRLQVGLACGEIVQVEGDCYGDAVNVASRLSDLSGADQIWATDTVVEQLQDPGDGVRLRSLGPINIRGKSQSCVVYRIEWHEEVVSALLTAPAGLDAFRPQIDATSGRIRLSCLDVVSCFEADELPIHIGRVAEAEFVVNDQRVSRLHVRLDWRNGSFVLEDLSSYGTWLRFAGGGSELALRRGEAVLHGDGEIALGAPFSDFTVPTVVFAIEGAGKK